MAGPRGPLPNPEHRHRNAPTIPTTKLPAAGREGPTPRLPRWVRLDKAGKAWWKWAWSTPQAAGWSSGDVALVARRATLEDDLIALEELDGRLDLAELLGIEDQREMVSHLEWIISTLKRLASGKIAVLKEMRECDDRLGLNPKASAALRWSITAPPPGGETTSPVPPGVTDLEDRRRRLAADA
jgi:hypothetical protein